MSTGNADLRSRPGGDVDPVGADAATVARALGVDPTLGLSAAEARSRLESAGPKRLAEGA